jgi:hypothetical protein
VSTTPYPRQIARILYCPPRLDVYIRCILLLGRITLHVRCSCHALPYREQVGIHLGSRKHGISKQPMSCPFVSTTSNSQTTCPSSDLIVHRHCQALPSPTPQCCTGLVFLRPRFSNRRDCSEEPHCTDIQREVPLSRLQISLVGAPVITPSTLCSAVSEDVVVWFFCGGSEDRLVWLFATVCDLRHARKD